MLRTGPRRTAPHRGSDHLRAPRRAGGDVRALPDRDALVDVDAAGGAGMEPREERAATCWRSWRPATSCSKPRASSCSAPLKIGKPHLAVGMGIKARPSRLFDTATNWIARLGTARTRRRPGCRTGEDPPLQVHHHHHRHRRRRVHPVRHRRREPLLAARCVPLRAGLDHGHLEPALGRRGELFGDDVVAAAMIGRLVYHAEGPGTVRRLLPHPPAANYSPRSATTDPRWSPSRDPQWGKTRGALTAWAARPKRTRWPVAGTPVGSAAASWPRVAFRMPEPETGRLDT